jgi:DNA-binding transcriptional MerR regulator
MIKENLKLSTLAELAMELKLNKSRIAYYVKMQLLVPTKRDKYRFLFDHDSAVKRIKEIGDIKKKKKKKGKI